MPATPDLKLDRALRQYVSPDMPFGPVDATNIIEPGCSARLYEWQNTAFAELMRGSHVIVGRRGSGKSALIQMVGDAEHLSEVFRSDRGRQYRNSVGLALRDLATRPDLVVQVDLPQQLFEMELQFATLRVRPSVEIVAQHWISRIFFLIGEQIRQQMPDLWGRLPIAAQRYITAHDLIELDPTDRPAVLSVRDFADLIRSSLAEHNKKVVVTFDSLEEYGLDGERSVVLAGLFRAAGQLIARQQSPVDVKFCLPAEMYEFLRHSVLNPDKDLTRKQFLHWTAAELMHVAAHRLKAYFELYDPEEHAIVREMRLYDRDLLHAFWRRYLPGQVTNRLGNREHTISYILRHTQLLPRQIIMVMNAIFRPSCQARLPWPVSEESVVSGVHENEPTFCDTIVRMFASQYPEIDLILKKVLPRLPRVFPFGTFERTWRQEARTTMAGMNKPEFWQFTRMMLATGAIGLVDGSSGSDLYVVGRFEFNSRHELTVSDKDTLCIHPIFSGIYNTAPAEERRVVLPRGSEHRFTPDD